ESLKLLVAELNHRVKNTLAVVQAIARQTFREAADTQKAWQSFEGRLVALAAAHNLLTRSKWESARLTAIAEDAFFARGMGENRRTVSGPDVRLAPKHALALSLVLHELCTNATKYGALSDEKGKVTLTWTPAGKGAVDLEWIERGGPPVPAVRKPGFGSRLLERSLARDLGAVIHLDFAPEGVRCTIKGLKHL
ncbi:MAG: sensor histidine kinase, partial [Alphaproteobacteria bacterium]